MEFNELLAAFAAKHGIEGLDGADGSAAFKVDGFPVELLNDLQTNSLFAGAEIGHPFSAAGFESEKAQAILLDAFRPHVGMLPRREVLCPAGGQRAVHLAGALRIDHTRVGGKVAPQYDVSAIGEGEGACRARRQNRHYRVFHAPAPKGQSPGRRRGG